MSVPNPFADEPLPDHGQRLQPAADPLNPYASPIGAGEYVAGELAGGGLWNDKGALVVHARAEFPPRCIITNEPTYEWKHQSVAWWYPIDWASRKKTFIYGVSPAALALQQRTRWRGMAVVLVSLTTAVAAIVASSLGWEFFHPGQFAMLLLVLGTTAIGGLAAAIKAGSFLRFYKVKRDFFWLVGARSPFLNSLPPWSEPRK